MLLYSLIIDLGFLQQVQAGQLTIEKHLTYSIEADILLI